MKTKARRIQELEAQVEMLKAEVEALTSFKKKWENVLKAKRKLHAKRRELFKFFGYKNYFNTPPRYWPPVLCCDCANCLTDGRTGTNTNSDRQQLKCSIIGTRVGKYSSCSQAKMKD